MASTPTTPTDGLLLSDDLMWQSRVSSTAQALGFRVRSTRNAAKLVELASQEPVRCVFIDLDSIQGDPTLPIQQVRKSAPPSTRLLAFGSHVDVATLQAARAAGCDQVLTRGQMAAGMHDLLQECLKSE